MSHVSGCSPFGGGWSWNGKECLWYVRLCRYCPLPTVWLLLSHMCTEMQDGMLVCSPSFRVLKVMQKTRRKLLEVPYSKLWGVFQVRRNQKKEQVWFPNSPGDIRIDRNAIHSKSAGICNGHSLQLVNLPLHLVCHPLHDRIRLQSNHLHKPRIPEEAAEKRDRGIVQKPKFRQQTLHRFQDATERKEARWASRLSLTFVKSSLRASKESSVPTRKSGIWNCKIQKTSAFHLQPLQHMTTTSSSKGIGACGHLLCPANAMTNLVRWSKYELQSSHFPAYWIRSGTSTFRSAMKRKITWMPARKKKGPRKGRPCA